MSEGKTDAPQNHDDNGSAKNVLDNQQVFQLFMDAIDKRVGTQLQVRFDSLRNLLIGSLGILVIIATAIGGVFFTYVVANITEKAAGEAVAGAVGEARFESRVSALNFRVLSIDIAEGFSNEDAEAITSEIRSLYSQQSDTESRDKLRFAVETAAKNYAQIDRPEFVFQLEEIAPDVFQTSGTVSQVMIQLLGNRLLADAGAPRSWTSTEGLMRKTYENYRRYAERASANGYPELYLAYEMLLRSVERGSKDEIGHLIEDLSRLSSADADNFNRLMMNLLAGDLDIRGSERISGRIRDFLCQFKEQNILLSTVSETVELECS